MSSRRRGVKIVIIPDSGSAPRSIKLSGKLFSFLKMLLISLLLLIVAAVVLSSVITQKVVSSYSVIKENDSLKIIAADIAIVKTNLVLMDQFVNYIREASSATGGKKLPSLSQFMKNDELRAKFSEVATADEYLSTPNILPVNGWISKNFNKLEGHEALDFAAAHDTPIRTTAAGIVDSVFEDDHLGNVIVIDHLKGYKTLYAHCSTILSTAIGTKVVRGETIALVGNSGRSSTGSHLHYEVIKSGVRIDPNKLLIMK
jgi:murein DD-endopeptidase MepM/ murein hydrolase activator NlpD